jgi:hypothetical protein
MTDCEWCGQHLDNIFQGDEVKLNENHYFVCMVCKDLIKKVEFRRLRR